MNFKLFTDLVMEAVSKIINNPIPNNHENSVISEQLKDQEIKEEQPKWSHFVKNTKVTSPFGNRKIFSTDGKMKNQFHNGTDYTGHNDYAMAPCDCIVEACLPPDYAFPYKYKYNSKTAQFEYTNPPTGRAWTPYATLRAVHDSNLKFNFRHGICDVPVGKEVKAGQVFYKIDSFGFSQGIHLHVEVIQNGKEVDPNAFIIGKLNVT